MSKPILDEKVLMVDDEAQLLDSFRRELRGKVKLETALGGEESLKTIKEKGPFAVVVSDFKMPGMNGVELLAAIKKQAPNTVRMMLTGYADMENTIKAVNEGNIFRFLTKPCSTELLLKSIAAGIQQYRLIIAEKQLLEGTLRGSIQVMTDLLALVKPKALNRATRAVPYVKDIIAALGIEDSWEYDAAALLSQIGCMTIPDTIMWKIDKGKPLSSKEKAIFARHPLIAAELISGIPRLEEVGQMIACQRLFFNGAGKDKDQPKFEDIPLGARILKVVFDFDSKVSSGLSKGKALSEMKEKSGAAYDPAILMALEQSLGVEAKYDKRLVSIYELKEGMILANDIFTKEGGKKVLQSGQQLTKTLIASLRNYNSIKPVIVPIQVIAPL